MATWVSKDTSKPYYGQEVSSDSNGRISVVRTYTGGNKALRNSTYYVNDSSGKPVLAMTEGVKSILQKEPVYKTTKGSLTTQPAQAESPTYRIGVGEKTMLASSALATKFGNEASNTPIYKTGRGNYTTDILTAERERLPIMNGPTRTKLDWSSPGSLMVTGYQRYIEPTKLGRGISAQYAYSSGLIASSIQGYDTSLSSTSFFEARKANVESSLALGYLRLGQLQSQEPSLGRSIDIGLTKFSIAGQKALGQIYEKPISYVGLFATSAAIGYGIGAGFSGAEGALTIASEGTKASSLVAYGIAGARGIFAGSFLAGSYLSGRQELATTGTIIKTPTAIAGGIIGASYGSELFKIENRVTPLEKYQEPKLTVVQGKNLKVGAEELIPSKEMVSRDVLKLGDTTIMESKRYNLVSLVTDTSGVYSPKYGERWITSTRVTTPYLEKSGISTQIGNPLVERAYTSLFEVETKTTRPAQLLLNGEGNGKYLPALKNTPTLYSAFETRMPSGEVVTGLQKSYINRPITIGETEFTSVRSRTYIFGAKEVQPSYELMSKSNVGLEKQPAIFKPDYPTSIITAKNKISDLGAVEGIIGTIARGSKAKGFESTAIYKKEYSFPQVYDFTRTTKLGLASITQKGAKAEYEVTKYSGRLQTKPIGERSSEDILKQFKSVYPKIKPTIVAFETGKDITPKEYKGIGIVSQYMPKITSKSLSIPITNRATTILKTTSKSKLKGAGSGAITELVLGVESKTKTIPMVAPISTTRQESETRQKTPTITRWSTNFRVNMVQMPTSLTRLDIEQSQITQRRVTQRLDTSTMQALEQAQITPNIPTIPTNVTPPPPFIPLAGFSLGLPQQSYYQRPSKKLKFKPQYFASIKATALGIKGKMPSARALQMGLTTRPIVL